MILCKNKIVDEDLDGRILHSCRETNRVSILTRIKSFFKFWKASTNKFLSQGNIYIVGRQRKFYQYTSVDWRRDGQNAASNFGGQKVRFSRKIENFCTFLFQSFQKQKNFPKYCHWRMPYMSKVVDEDLDVRNSTSCFESFEFNHQPNSYGY